MITITFSVCLHLSEFCVTISDGNGFKFKYYV